MIRNHCGGCVSRQSGSRRHAARGRGKRAVRVQRIRLHQHPRELHPIQELPQGTDLTGGAGGVAAWGVRHAERVGVQTHLGNETRCVRSGLIDRAPQGLAVADQRFDRVRYPRLCRHPLLQQGLKTLDIKLSQQQAKRRVRRRAGDLGAEQLVEGLAMPFGESLHPHQRTLVAQDGQDRHQQHPPLREAHPATHAAVGQRLEKTDQISCSSRVLERRGQR